MMDKVVITDSNAFQEVITSFESSKEVLKELFQRQNNNVERINETDAWSGAASKAMYGKYKELNSNYNHISYSLDLYIKFLKKTLEDYTRLEEEINKNMENVAHSLDVNS